MIGCSQGAGEQDTAQYERELNSRAETRIDSAYAAITAQCDTLVKYKVPLMADSILKTNPQN